MKLIIDIDEAKYATFQNDMYCGMMDVDLYRNIKNGIPIDEIKMKIQSGYCNPQNDYDRGRNYGLHMAIQIMLNEIK